MCPSATGDDLRPSPQRSERGPLAARAAPAGGERRRREWLRFCALGPGTHPRCKPCGVSRPRWPPLDAVRTPRASSCALSGRYPGEAPAVRTCPGRGVARSQSRPGCLGAIGYQLLTLPGPPFPAELGCKGLGKFTASLSLSPALFGQVLCKFCCSSQGLKIRGRSIFGIHPTPVTRKRNYLRRKWTTITVFPVLFCGLYLGVV